MTTETHEKIIWKDSKPVWRLVFVGGCSSVCGFIFALALVVSL